MEIVAHPKVVGFLRPDRPQELLRCCPVELGLLPLMALLHLTDPVLHQLWLGVANPSLGAPPELPPAPCWRSMGWRQGRAPEAREAVVPPSLGGW